MVVFITGPEGGREEKIKCSLFSGGVLLLIRSAMLTLLTPSAYATSQTFGQKEIASGSIFSMFVIMTIVFLLVLRFGRKKPHINQNKSSEVKIERKMKDIEAAKGHKENSRYSYSDDYKNPNGIH